MAMTALVVEIVITGLGALVWIAFALATLLGHSWVRIDALDTAGAVVVIVALSYVLGVVVDALADRAFESPKQRLSGQLRPQDTYRLRQAAFDKRFSRTLLEYNRSRQRVTRGWVINSAAILLFSNTFIWSRLPADLPRGLLSTAASVFFILLGLGSYYAWIQLVTTEYETLAHEDKISQGL